MDYRVEKDSMGEVQVPAHAYYAAQTQRAVENFPISGVGIKTAVIKALGHIKKSAAQVNGNLKLIDQNIADCIVAAATEVIEGKFDEHFPIDIFQTGSGTSSNMNSNEVIAKRATELAREKNFDFVVHPNDHVNFGQSSNDVFPTAIRVAARLALETEYFPGLKRLKSALNQTGVKNKDVVKTGKTHLMDAMPVSFAQVFSGYERQVETAEERVRGVLGRLCELPQGGTAVGTGINTHPEFGSQFAKAISTSTGFEFTEAKNHFEAQATVDAPTELSSALKVYATSLMKIANDLRWMNSGPNSGISEVQLKALQPGSSIMPGKVNPVIEESTCMVCAQVIGNDTAIAIGNQAGSFELNVMLPMIAHNLIESIELLGRTSKNLAERSVELLEVKKDNVTEKLTKNPILVTALNPVIGYDLAAKIAKQAFADGRPLIDVALEMTDLSKEELEKVLDPMKMTKGGFVE